MNIKTLAFMLAVLLASINAQASGQQSEQANDDVSAVAHGDVDGNEDESEEGLLELSDESLQLAGIVVQKLEARVLPELIYAPGEVQLDQYRSAEVTPLVDALVSERHAKLGDEVKVGQILVTLVSVEVVAAQGELMVAATEWRRVRSLGKATVSAKRYTEAEVAYQQARLKLLAYGLDDKQIEAAASGERKRPLGEFDLSAPVAGTLLRDDFRVGQRIEPGQSLFLIADESRIWVKANLSPRQAKGIEVGMSAQVKMDGHWHTGRVIQKHHLLDERTRTVPVRIAVDPGEEHHHGGELVQVAIESGTGSNRPILVVSESALTQDSDGNWTVFVEESEGHFGQVVVQRGEPRGAFVPITGITQGTAVVTQGAFFLASQLAKSGFDND